MTIQSKNKKTRKKSKIRVHPEYVTESKMWYKDQYRRTTFIALITLGLLVVSLSVNIIQAMTKTQPVYFAATQDLKLAQMTPLDRPYLTQAGVLNWVANTIVDTLSLDFLRWRKQLMHTRINFSETAFKQVILSLKSSGILPLIRKSRLNLHTVIESAPVITASGKINGVYAWQIEVPILLSYESSKGIVNTQKLLAQVLVKRANTNVHLKGIYITQLILANTLKNN